MVEEGLQHLKMELAVAQPRMHPEEVIQEAEGVFPEEEETEEGAEK